MLNGRFWAVSELFSAIGASFGGSSQKCPRKSPRQTPATQSSNNSHQSPAARKARLRGMLSAIEQGAVGRK